MSEKPDIKIFPNIHLTGSDSGLSVSAQIGDHTLNACLARVIGVEVRDRLQDFILPKWVSVKTGEYWNPLHNASQMEEVEAWLVRTSHGWSVETFGSKYFAKVWNKHPQMGSQNVWEQDDPDKKRAFALAIWEMEQSQKETT